MIKTDFSGIFGIKHRIGIQERSLNPQPQFFHLLKCGLKIGLQVVRIIMIARNNFGRTNNIPLNFGHRQDIASFGFFPALDTLRNPPFFGNRMRTIKIDFRQI